MNEDPTHKSQNAGQIEWREGDMPYSLQFGDYYYSKADGRAECNHVFIDGNGLKTRFLKEDPIIIGELGFGTGLNFLETMRQFRKFRGAGNHLQFHSFELYPLSRNTMAQALSAWPDMVHDVNELLSRWPEKMDDDLQIEFRDGIFLHLHIGDVSETIRTVNIGANAWYLDGFSPARNKDMWSIELMRELHRNSAEDATLSSYTAAGWVRRNLQDVGFEITKRPGFAGKRDMIVGIKTD